MTLKTNINIIKYKDKYFEKNLRLETLINFHYRKCMLSLQYLSDSCLHRVYVWRKFSRKNISNWVIIWIKFKILWLLSVLYSTLAPSGPQLQKQLAYKSWLGTYGPDRHLTPKIGHLQWKVGSWKLHSNPRYNPGSMFHVKRRFVIY